MNKFTILLFLLMSINSYAQTIENVQLVSPPSPIIGSTPNFPSAYIWTEYSNILQGVNIHLTNNEKKEVFFQQNNHELAFNTLGTQTYLYKVEVKYDDGEWVEVFNTEDDNVGATQSVGWITTPSSFNTLGYHTLQVKYHNQSPTSPFLREYDALVIPASQGFFKDNTQILDPGFTSGNTITLWDHPTLENAKPILISEGYDASNDFFAELYRQRGDYLSERLFELGYKIYVLNYNLANQSMRNNAAVLNSAINYVSSINDGEDVGLVGVSMGGVISRYTLAKGENDGNPLPVSFFASFDSPQQGAVIDRNFIDFIHGQVDEFPALGNEAAKELLIYNPFDETGVANTNFFAELNSFNGTGYPTSIPTVGVAFSNGLPNPGEGLIWEAITEGIGSGGTIFLHQFEISKEWAASGSYLPTSATNIAPQHGTIPASSFAQGQFYRSDEVNPTFIPHISALDLVDGKSNFCFSLKTDESENFFFHDQLPNSTIDGFIGVVSGFNLNQIEQNESFNFTSKVGRYVVSDLDVRGKMFINKNSFSGSSFNPQSPAPLPKFDIGTSICEPVDIIVFSDAELRMGDGQNHIGELTISENSQLVIKKGGQLKIKAGSKLVIEEGGSLTIEDGTIIDLQGNGSSIHIKEGGELVINGEFKFKGNGYFQFDKGNILTLNNDFIMNGNGKDKKFIRLNENTILGIGNKQIHLSHGLVEYAKGSSIRVEEGGIVDFSHVTLSGAQNGIDNSIGIDSEHPRRIDLLDVTVSNLAIGIEVIYNNNSTQPYFTPEFDIDLCIFENCEIGILGLNGWEDNDALQLNISSSLFDGKENGDIGLWANGFSNLDIQGSAFQNYKGGSKGIQAMNIQSLKLNKSRIINNDIGIFIPEEANLANQSNVFLTTGTSVENNGIGILIEKGGVLDSDNDFGMVTMDCARLINNNVGIQGVDVLLNIDACFNSGQFGTCDNSMVRPNVFVNGDVTNSLFRICYEDREDIEEVSARGNYWEASGLNGLPNHFDHLLRSANSSLPCYGTSDIQLVVDNNLFTMPQSCGETIVVTTPEPGEIIKDECYAGDDTSELVQCMYGNGQGQWSLNSRFSKGYKAFANELEGEAILEYQSLASISDDTRNSYCAPCRHYIDVARVMAHGNDKVKGLASKNTDSEIGEHLSKTQMVPNIRVYPNPASDNFELYWEAENYELKIINMFGVVVHQMKGSYTTRIDVTDWSDGIYFFELRSEAQKRPVKKKVVVQHF